MSPDVSQGEEDKALEEHSGKRYKNPTLTVDGILVNDGKLLLVRRGREPERGKLALPGGIVEYGETTEKAVVREVREETGIGTRASELLGVYSQPDRDPRGHFITLVYVLALENGELQPGDDAADAVFHPIDDIPPLAFDHNKIVADYLRRRGKMT